MSELFRRVCLADGLHVVSEYRFDPIRHWRFDWALPSHKVALEVEGGAFSRGRHTRGAGFVKDMEKYNAATLAGWKVLRVTPDQLLSDGPVLLRQALAKSEGCL